MSPPDQSAGDSAQIRLIAEQLVEAAVISVANKHPELKESAIPAPIKWAAGIISGVFAALITSGCIWMVVTLSDMKVQVANITTQLGQNGVVDARFGAITQRIERLEDYHKGSVRQ